jgi:hypothetical protein
MKSRKILIKVSNAILILIAITACSPSLQSGPASPTPSPTKTVVPPTETQVPPTSTYTATSTNSPTTTPTPTPTDTITPTLTPSPTPTETPTQTPANTVQVSSGGDLIVKYLVHKGTGGPVGCGDSLVPVSADFLRTGDVREDVKIAITSLFSTGSQYVGDLYNPLFLSKLRVNDVSFNKRTGNVTIHLTGSFTKPKEDCDKLLYRAQVWDTARQFPEVKLATIWLNQYLLGDLLVVFKK